MDRSFLMLGCLIAISMAATQTAWSQCCGGAQHVSSDSVGGRFRVEGESLTPLRQHGPYHFKFKFLERTIRGEYKELNSFEMKWDIRDHFRMNLMVSPVGNGFAVDFPSGCLTFYSREGRQLFQLDSDQRLDSKTNDDNVIKSYMLHHRDFELDDDGYNIQILKTVWFGNAGMHADESSLFLPLGLEATSLLDSQVIWYLIHADHKRGEELVLQALKKVTDGDQTPSDEETNELLKFSFMALPVIENALKKTKDDRVRARLTKLRANLEPWQKASDEAGERDLDLIASMLFYPDSAIRKLARSRLDELLQEPIEKLSAKECHDWVREHQDELKWDASEMQYVNPNKAKRAAPLKAKGMKR